MTVNELLAVLLSLHVWQKLFFRARLGVQLQMVTALKITAKGASSSPTSNYLAAEVNLMLESLQMGTMPTRHWRASINLEADALRRATTCCGRSGFKAAPGGGGTGPSLRDFVAEEANKGSGNATRTRTRSTGKDHNPKQPRKLEKAKKQVHPVGQGRRSQAAPPEQSALPVKGTALDWKIFQCPPSSHSGLCRAPVFHLAEGRSTWWGASAWWRSSTRRRIEGEVDLERRRWPGRRLTRTSGAGRNAGTPSVLWVQRTGHGDAPRAGHRGGNLCH